MRYYLIFVRIVAFFAGIGIMSVNAYVTSHSTRTFDTTDAVCLVTLSLAGLFLTLFAAFFD